MNTKRTLGIILRRINYGEADRILTLLTRDYGKISVIAKGVRKEKSKLAGGIELFSESDISYLPGKSDLSTLVSTQLIRHFGNIHTHLDRMKVTSEFLKRIDHVTENDTSSDYYDLVIDMFVCMNTQKIPVSLVGAWSMMRLTFLMGEVINVEQDSAGNEFSDDINYRFSYEDSRFVADKNGDVEPRFIKFLRLLATESPARLMAIKDIHSISEQANNLLELAYLYTRPNVGRN